MELPVLPPRIFLYSSLLDIPPVIIIFTQIVEEKKHAYATRQSFKLQGTHYVSCQAYNQLTRSQNLLLGMFYSSICGRHSSTKSM